MGAGIQFHGLKRGLVRRSQSSFSDDPIGEETDGTGKDMKHFTERKVCKTHEAGQDMNIPEHAGQTGPVNAEADGGDDLGRSITGKGPLGPGMA
jgi:hypothetical protein